MTLDPGTSLHGFTVKTSEDLPEIDGRAVVLIHEESGARLLYLQNDDSNKSFAIGFRTPPADDTGVFHILEHSVLCGSDRFPVKEPFVNLLKSSMQTFLNAMTFSDKTLYPVASTNEKDLFNLMDVYLDAVFHPLIYKKRTIFQQEGWHYEFADEGKREGLIYNGVVFNEMKGALSDANSIMYNGLQNVLFSDTCYAFESGGTPESIPTLTYEQFLEEHRRHYRTDNSYIVLYGDVDIDRALAFLDERYLTPVADEQRKRDAERAAAGLDPLLPRAIEYQEPQRGQVRIPMNTAPENECMGAGYVIGESSDRLRVFAVDILLDALLGSNEAPLKRALLDKGSAKDIHAFVSEAVLQPFAVVQFQMPKHDDGWQPVVMEYELKRILDEGLDRELIRAALAHSEFEMREHDMGPSDGVVYAIDSLSGWLYNDDAVLDYLRYEDLFVELRKRLDEGYFEDLAREVFLDNDHSAYSWVDPRPERPDFIAEELAEKEAGLTDDDRAAIAANQEELRAAQEAPDTPEALATLPFLTIDDIGEAPERPGWHLDETAPIACLRHDVPTHGIIYVYRYFDLDCVSFEELPYVTVLVDSLGKLGTAKRTAAELDTAIQGKLGNLSFFLDVFGDEHDPNNIHPKLIVGSSALSSNVDWLASLPREVMLETDLTDTGKILDRLQQHKIVLEQSFINSGHNCAATRMQSYFMPSGVLREQIGNVGFYRFVCDLIEHFDERAEALTEKLADLAQRIFRDSGCLVSFAGSEEDYRRFWDANPGTGRIDAAPAILEIPAPVRRNEGFIIPTDICFAALGWDRRQLDEPFTGAWLTAARILSYDYLWNEVRVKGGAYGVGFRSMRLGNMQFYSYRDPHLDETLERFAQAAEWLGAFEPSAEDMEGFVVATVANLDAPNKPRSLVRKQGLECLTGFTEEKRLRIRREAAGATVEGIHALAPVLSCVADKQAICVFGNRDILSNANVELDLIELI